MTFRSNAAERERDQLGTNTSAGRDLSSVEVSPQPLPSSSTIAEICEAVTKTVVPCDYITTWILLICIIVLLTISIIRYMYYSKLVQ